MIPFNKAFLAGKELYYIAQAVISGQIKGDGPFTKKCNSWIEKKFGIPKVLLTTSCTAALEMAAILLNIQKDDEVIMPSYTFVSTANAFVLRGAKPVFVDIRFDTLNIDESKIEGKITKKTKAICPVHYGGVGCEMDTIMDIANRYNLVVVEDAAQGMTAEYKGCYLGTIGHIGAYSFHETKNYSSGEGGAILINDLNFIERAEIIWEKGTNRRKFFSGEVNKYTWVDIGSSFLPSEIVAAFLFAQLENTDEINIKRFKIWNRYREGLQALSDAQKITFPTIPLKCKHNAHLFYILLKNESQRDELIKYLKNKGVSAVFHYFPLHLSPMGMRFGFRRNDLPITENISERLLRLPFYNDMTEKEQNKIIELIFDFFYDL